MKKATLALVFLVLAGCATTQTVTEKQPMQGHFSKYTSLRIEYRASDVEDALPYFNQFAATLKQQLDAGHYFKSVTLQKDGAAQLVAQCQVTKVDRPSQAMNLLTHGAQNSTVTVDVSFREAKGNRDLASVEATGNSANRSRSSVGGITLTSSNDLTTTALQEAATAVAGYMQKNMTGGAPAHATK